MKKKTTMETEFRRTIRTNMEAFLKETEFKLMNPTPNLCPTCLGDEYPVKFEHKEEDEKDCKICSSKFIVARWKTDPNTETERRIEICYSCGLRNICQLCNQECPWSDPLKIDTSKLSVRPTRLMKMKFSRLIPDDGLGCCHTGLLEYCRVCLMDRERERREMRT